MLEDMNVCGCHFKILLHWKCSGCKFGTYFVHLQNVLIKDAAPTIPSTMFEPGLKIYDNETLRDFKFPSAGYM